MNIMTFICLALGLAYSVPVVIGGFVKGKVSGWQSIFWGASWSGFIYFGGFLK